MSRSSKFQSYLFPENFDYVIKNVALVGFMYFLFLSGVRMDVKVIKRARKKHWYVATVGMILPICCSLCVGLILRKSLDKEMARFSSIWGISLTLSIAAFPVLYPIARELNLLSSSIARMALSTAVISDLIGLNALLVFETLKQGEYKAINALFYLVSFIILASSFIAGARQAMLWIIRATPEEKPVDQTCVTAILVTVMVAGLVSDTFGLTVANGPLWLGLAVPNGPPLGTALVEKMETIVRDILRPFSFMYIGFMVDVASMSSHWSHLHPLMLMVLSAYVVKMVSTFVASRFHEISIRDSLTLSLLVGLKGDVDLMLFIHLNDMKLLDKPHFTFLVVSAVSMTAVATPLIAILYDPAKPYMINKRRNIQHSPPNAQLHVLACMHSEENLSGLMRLIHLSNPTVASPLSVDALCLVELVGQSNPVLIDHQKEEEEEEEGAETFNLGPIHKALKKFQEARGDDCINIYSYTTFTSKRSMYQDVCQLALSNKACLVVVPATMKQVFQSLNSDVLLHAPCSVAVLVDKSPYQNLVHGSLRSPFQNIALLFLGGADAREALSYAERMAENPAVSLSVVRFLPHNNEGDNEIDKKLDDGLVTQFWLKSEGNSRVVYREVVVKNGEETIAAIQAMKKQRHDLWIVGRKHGINPVLLRGLGNWSDCNELGVIGECVASADFDSRASVLAVQQQILRSQEKVSDSLMRGFSLSTWKW